MSNLRITEQARTDLDELWEWHAQRAESAADALLDKIMDKLKFHAQFPGMGRRRDDLAPGLRSFVISPYVIFYLPADDGIVVVRVLHGSRDIDSIMKEDDPT
ncbi:MAG: type II toxin-antitoxin system RelE/ParE family toxin [Planctomycetia bacterium]|nr:type II toxin-antitoxin system RelE/ParE family toxin [Planctomycetia bacterium]